MFQDENDWLREELEDTERRLEEALSRLEDFIVIVILIVIIIVILIIIVIMIMSQNRLEEALSRLEDLILIVIIFIVILIVIVVVIVLIILIVILIIVIMRLSAGSCHRDHLDRDENYFDHDHVTKSSSSSCHKICSGWP